MAMGWEGGKISGLGDGEKSLRAAALGSPAQ